MPGAECVFMAAPLSVTGFAGDDQVGEREAAATLHAPKPSV
jgi:hypothetical protein